MIRKTHDTGIYTSEQVIPERVHDFAEISKRLKEINRKQNDIQLIMSDYETMAHAIINDPERNRLPIGGDARYLLAEIRFLKVALKQKNWTAIALHAHDMGVYAERIRVRPYEPHAMRGQKTMAAAKKSHSKTHGSPAEKAQRWSDYQYRLDRIIAQHPHLSHSAASERVAVDLTKIGIVVSSRTIRNHTKYPG